MKYLIVTAEDFGLSQSINRGIIKARKDGIVTSMGLMPSGEAFSDAVKLLKDCNIEEVCAHLSLTETAPCSDPRDIPSLVTKDVRLPKNYAGFLLRFFLKRIKNEHIYIELKSQLDKIRAAGFRLMCLGSHQYIHMVPSILDIFVKLAKEYNIPAIRYPRRDLFIPPFSVKKLYKKCVLLYFENAIRKILREAKVKFTDDFLGILDSGNIREDSLIEMLTRLKEGTTELVCHPGFLGPQVLERYKFHLNCETDLAALISRRVKKVIEEKGIRLITYQEFIVTAAS